MITVSFLRAVWMGANSDKQMKWLKNLEMVLLYGVMGAVVGSLVGPYWFGIQVTLVQTVLHARYSGFPILLINFVVIVGNVFGAVTGCALVHSFGQYRSLAGGSLLVFGLTASLFMLYDGIGFARDEGRRMAIALDGVGLLWSLQLMLWGSFLCLGRSDGRKAP